mgnify:CR=1 FL=1
MGNVILKCTNLSKTYDFDNALNNVNLSIETGKIIGYIPTEYNGYAPLKEDGTYETKNILGKKYDVTNQIPDLVKPIDGADYILAEIPPKGPAGTINVSDKRIRDIYTADEINAAGLNPNAYVNNVIYSYVKKTKAEEVNRTIKYVQTMLKILQDNKYLNQLNRQ